MGFPLTPRSMTLDDEDIPILVSDGINALFSNV